MIVFLISFVTTVLLYLQRDIFNAWFFASSLLVMVVGFLALHHVHFAPHYKNLRSSLRDVAHFLHTEHLVSHLKSFWLSVVLFVSANLLLLYIVDPILEYLILGGFAVSMGIYFVSMSDVLQKFFTYEEKHLHLFTFVKLFTAVLSIAGVVCLYAFQTINLVAALVVIWALFVYLLYQFSLYVSEKTPLHYKHLFISMMALGAVVVLYMLGRSLFSIPNMMVTLFGYYYMCWGIFKHYLLGDLRWKIVFEYVIFALLIVGVVFSQNIFWQRVL